ncbi:phospho-N-acetylmuramoyl-pentapeptide-transferase [uncultured Dialister sp.]|uniref:phospho-N-acetylmuramoyl-pentapeptide- transferase n=1 Tax=uncultured Dialister sp. TaxID=278064 RepID=UPI0025E9D7DC|nr:phospho-N-acetylmuramoyl-pentapeptide-transferase [uncultured Dialister sp.]
MQLIDLSDVKDFHAGRFLLFWLIASIVAVIVAYSIGQENKHKWFRQRSTNGIFERRGVFGNLSLLGVPTSIPGLLITIGIFAASGLIWALLVFAVLPIFGINL